MKHPVVNALIALSAVMLVLVVAGTFTSGETRIERISVLNGPPERVWPFFADLRGWPVWYRAPGGTPRMTSSVITQGTSSGLNAVRHAEDSVGDWWDEKVTAYDIDKRLELTGISTPGRHNWRQEIKLEPVGTEQTKVTWVLEYAVSGPIIKLLNKSRTEEQFGLYMEGAMKNIGPLIPSAAEWGEPEVPTAKAEQPGAPAAGAQPPASVGTP